MRRFKEYVEREDGDTVGWRGRIRPGDPGPMA